MDPDFRRWLWANHYEIEWDGDVPYVIGERHNDIWLAPEEEDDE